jgi:hypothetical protein
MTKDEEKGKEALPEEPVDRTVARPHRDDGATAKETDEIPPVLVKLKKLRKPGDTCVCCSEKADTSVDIRGFSRWILPGLGIVMLLTVGGLAGAGFAIGAERPLLVVAGALLAMLALLLQCCLFIAALFGALWLRRLLSRRFGTGGAVFGMILVLPAWIILVAGALAMSVKTFEDVADGDLLAFVVMLSILGLVLVMVLGRVYARLPVCSNCVKKAKSSIWIRGYNPFRRTVVMQFKDRKTMDAVVGDEPSS